MTVRELIDALEREPNKDKVVQINLVSKPCVERGEDYLQVGDIDYGFDDVFYIDAISSYGSCV